MGKNVRPVTRCCSIKIMSKPFTVVQHADITPPLPPELRFKLLFDADSYQQIDVEVSADDPLKFKDSKRYPDRLKTTRAKTGTQDAIAVAMGHNPGHQNSYRCL